MQNIFLKNAQAIAVAASQIFVHDILGDQNNPQVIQYAKDLFDAGYTAFKDYVNDDVSWCSIFCGWVLLQIGITPMNSEAARSYLDFGDEVIGEPVVGDIVIFWRDSPTSWKGHVGFFLNEVTRQGETFYRILSGNTEDQVKCAEFPKSKVLKVRRIVERVLPSHSTSIHG